DRCRGVRRAPVHGAGGPWHRPPEQAARVRAAGAGPGHGRGQPRARLPRRLARLRDRLPDPRRPRADDDPPADEQSAQDGERDRLRPDSRRAGADRGAAERGQPALPADETCEARPPPAPPGPEVRARRVMSERPEDAEDWPLRDFSARLRPPAGMEPEPVEPPREPPEPEAEILYEDDVGEDEDGPEEVQLEAPPVETEAEAAPAGQPEPEPEAAPE